MRFSLLLVALASRTALAQPPARSSAAIDSTRAPRDTARSQGLEAVTVRAVRGGDAAVAQTTLGSAALSRGYTGQDVPLLLQQAPGISTWSQSGSQWNYSYFRIRGIDQSRINLTLDGIPLNEPEDQQLYFSNFADLANSIQSVQIQRGVGAGTYGQASFGGSVNFETVPLAATPRGAEVQLGAGSFGALRGAAEYASGLGDDRTAVYARFSNQRAEGYRLGSSHAGNSAMVSAGYFGDRDVLKLTLLTGAESNGQAYTPVPRAVLDTNRRANPIAGVGDRFRQSLAALAYTRLLSERTSLATTVYGFDAGGRYDYPTWVANTPDPRWELASRWGGVLSALHYVGGRTSFDAGVHALTYYRDHMFGDRADLKSPGYANRGFKTEGSAFAKASRAVGDVTFYGDLQLREAAFRYRPTAGSPVPESRVSWRFVNPRLGLSWAAAGPLRLFASAGSTGREPTRSNLLNGADDLTAQAAPDVLPFSRVRPERVFDVESGAEWSGRALHVRGNLYAMEFRDEIALIGSRGMLGGDLRRNVKTSFRRGVEVDATWRMDSTLTLGATAAVSRNRIGRYVDAATGRAYLDVPHALTPSFIAGQQVTWRVMRALALTADGRYQSRQYLDPTGDLARTAPAFFLLDGGARLLVGRHEVLLQGRNLLDRFAFTAGDVRRGVPRYFVTAPRSIEVNARLRF